MSWLCVHCETENQDAVFRCMVCDEISPVVLNYVSQQKIEANTRYVAAMEKVRATQDKLDYKQMKKSALKALAEIPDDTVAVKVLESAIEGLSQRSATTKFVNDLLQQAEALLKKNEEEACLTLCNTIEKYAPGSAKTKKLRQNAKSALNRRNAARQEEQTQKEERTRAKVAELEDLAESYRAEIVVLEKKLEELSAWSAEIIAWKNSETLRLIAGIALHKERMANEAVQNEPQISHEPIVKPSQEVENQNTIGDGALNIGISSKPRGRGTRIIKIDRGNKSKSKN